MLNVFDVKDEQIAAPGDAEEFLQPESKDEYKKLDIVTGSNAVVEPAAVMVEQMDASVALFAMERIISHARLAGPAVKLVLFGFEALI